jgi:4-diphosphocytidyl-2-C-methyl-D-erythritol kinase
MEFTAPAKINLYLRVIGKRGDGYHEIETLFERISIFDRISIEPASGRTILTCDDHRVPTDEDSLMLRAVEAFKKRSGVKGHYAISLKKNVPIGAGLGGGSSDTAALLRGLNEIAGHPIGEDDLLGIARDLGADIPFFMSGASFGFGTGRGDIVRECGPLPEIWHVLVTPPFEVSTGSVYSKVPPFALTNDMPVDKILSAFLSGNGVDSVSENLRNDLQDIVLRDFPVLAQVFSGLRKAGAKGVLLSGSGPTVYGIFDRDRTEKAAEMLRVMFPAEKNWKVHIAHTY